VKAKQDMVNGQEMKTEEITTSFTQMLLRR